MKNIILLVCLALSLIVTARAIDPDEALIPRKSAKILIKNTLSAEQNFALVGRTLVDNDYTIESKDKDFGSIKTGCREVPKTGGEYFLSFSVRDGSIAVTGQNMLDISIGFGGIRGDAAFTAIANEGMRGSFARKAWDTMNAFALKLGSQLQYVAPAK